MEINAVPVKKDGKIVGFQGIMRNITDRKRAEEELREREAVKIIAYKKGLSADERARLREKAEAEIRNSGQFKEEFITEYLIEAKENDLIRDRLELANEPG